jgi:GR25 family glycosyltransferase involved in LPS biosynthesis
MDSRKLAYHYLRDAIDIDPLLLNNIYITEPMNVVGRTYFAYQLSLGAIGIVLSHLSVLQDAYNSGYETIWVMEDDIEIMRDPHLISDYIDSLDIAVGRGNWDILFTDQDTKDHFGNRVPCQGYAWRPNYVPRDTKKFAKVKNIGNQFREIGARFGAYSMILRRSGMKKILDFIKQYHVFLPYDLDMTLPPNIRLFTVDDDIVSTQPNASTDNSAPYYRYVL